VQGRFVEFINYTMTGAAINQHSPLATGQQSFVPVYSTDTLSPPEHANDSECLAECANTKRLYLCKKNIPYLAASEWICHHIARACGVDVPDFAAIKIEGHTDYLFGTEWMTGAIGYALALPIVKNADIFSAALALDYAVSNPDRHLENYLYLEKDGEVQVKVIDFSRAFLVAGWPLPDLPMDDMAATMEAIDQWKSHHPFVASQANQIIGRWLNLPASFIDPVLDGLAPGWLDVPMRNKISDWWGSPIRMQRAYDAAYQLNYVK
jgi:hypothetical protein